MDTKKLFAETIIDSDLFLDMPVSAQALYFHLAARSDNSGIVANPKKIMRAVCGSDDDLELLETKMLLFPTCDGDLIFSARFTNKER